MTHISAVTSSDFSEGTLRTLKASWPLSDSAVPSIPAVKVSVPVTTDAMLNAPEKSCRGRAGSEKVRSRTFPRGGPWRSGESAWASTSLGDNADANTRTSSI